MQYTALLCAALVSTASAAAAQVTTVDEGSFTVSRGGVRIGREDFAIRRTASAGGDVLVASATVSYDDRRLSPALSTDPSGFPLRYQVEVRAGDDVQERLAGTIGRGRFSARVRTPRGESAKEYIVADGALILDDDVFHQYFFLAQGDRTGTVPVVIPRRNVQLAMRVEERGTETIDIAGTRISARHLVLSEPGGAARHVWVDARGRVLKVTLDDRDIVALRDEPPR
jgi:hypothetical protein